MDAHSREAAGVTLDRILAGAERLPAVRRADVRAGDRIFVRTRNSLYLIVVGRGGACAVSGGWFDRRGDSPVTTTVAGCTWGGSVIKSDLMAAVGLCIEFGNRLVTTEARSIIVLRRETLN